MDKIQTSVGERLKAIRQELNLSQEALGEKIGLTRAAIAAVETNKNKLSQDVLCQLILTLNININYLIADIGEKFIQKNHDEFDVFLTNKIKNILKSEGFVK